MNPVSETIRVIAEIIHSLIERGDLAHLALALWAVTDMALVLLLLHQLAAANQRFDEFVRELARFNGRHDAPGDSRTSSSTANPGRSTRPQGASRASDGPRLRAPSSAASAREIFGRFVRTLEELDAARGNATPATRQQKAETTQSWEVPGCGKS
jgi:hypothetical protein